MEEVRRPEGAFEFLESGEKKFWDVFGTKLYDGNLAPKVELIGQDYLHYLDSGIISTRDLSKPTLFYVINSINTPVCNRDMQDFSEFAREVGGKAEIYTIDGANASFTLAEFAKQNNLQQKLVSAGSKFPREYGVQLDDPLHLLQRSVFVLQDGIIRHAEYFADQGEQQDYDLAKQTLLNIVNS